MLPTTLRRTLLHSTTPRNPLPTHRALYITTTTTSTNKTTRSFRTTARSAFPKKTDMDKDSIDTDSNEYSKSGGDSASASATEKAAFDPSQTRPEEEHDTASKEAGGDANNPLNVSPGNQEVSQPRGAQEGGAQGSADEEGSGSGRARSSGGGSPSKNGGDKSGGGPA